MATIRFEVREIHSAKFEARVSDDEAREFEHLTDYEKKERADELMSRGCAEYVDGSGEYVETMDHSALEFEVTDDGESDDNERYIIRIDGNEYFSPENPVGSWVPDRVDAVEYVSFDIAKDDAQKLADEQIRGGFIEVVRVHDDQVLFTEKWED